MEADEPIYLRVLLRSLSFAAVSVILTPLLCHPVAFWVSRLPDRWRLVLLFLITLPFFFTLIVRLYAWLLILKPNGLLNTALVSFGVIGSRSKSSIPPRRWCSGWST